METRGGDLDETEVEEARARARARAEVQMKESAGTPDYAAAELAEASARLSVLKKLKNAGR